MYLEVIKFGGSCLADNEKLEIAAKKTVSFLSKKDRVVVIVSAQGDTTNQLLSQASELSLHANKRELDMLVSVGEQIACAKFAILLQEMGYKAVSLTGWQAGITTNSDYTNAKIYSIYTDRIEQELQNSQIVVIAGFQGTDSYNNITTIGRDGSDTTAVSIAAALHQKKCYIFTDTDGIYDKDPHQFKDAKKIKKISYDEMTKLAQNGAKVLHDRCINIAKKYSVNIIVSSPTSKEKGSIVTK